MDGSKNEHAPLVICPNSAYHNMLHARLRIVKAGGHPDKDRICCMCKTLQPIANFIPTPRKKKQWICRPCKRKKDLHYYLIKTVAW